MVRLSYSTECGRSKIDAAVQERLLAAMRENPHRAIPMLRQLLEAEGTSCPAEHLRSQPFTASCNYTEFPTPPLRCDIRRSYANMSKYFSHIWVQLAFSYALTVGGLVTGYRRGGTPPDASLTQA